MLIVKLLVNENLLNAESALNKADCDNIIELCRKYLLVLNNYRDELSKLRGAPEISFQTSSSLARELTEQVRKAIRSAIEITTRERNQIESLLNSFTAISGYEAVDTFNHLQYRGFDNWELQASGVRSKTNSAEEIMTIQDAVKTAGLLRREAYITNKTAFFK
jgi:hypothetical protein